MDRNSAEQRVNGRMVKPTTDCMSLNVKLVRPTRFELVTSCSGGKHHPTFGILSTFAFNGNLDALVNCWSELFVSAITLEAIASTAFRLSSWV